VLLQLVDATGDDPVEAFEIVMEELEAYGAGLLEKPMVIALNKVDAVDDDIRAMLKADLEEASGCPVMELSGASGEGVEAILDLLLAAITTAQDDDATDAGTPEDGAGTWSPV
jgi:GTP-binding protein